MKIFEVVEQSTDHTIAKFVPWAAEQLQLNASELPEIKVVDQVPDAEGTTFGCYRPDHKCIYIVAQGRHIKDVLRTLAHELTHYKQDAQGVLNPESGATGSDEENEANAQAGVIMRNFNQANPE